MGSSDGVQVVRLSAGGPQSERAVKPVDQTKCHQSQ